FGSSIAWRLAGQALGPQARAAVTTAKRRTLAIVDDAALRPPARRRLRAASEPASVSAFHVGMGISAGLVGLGGVLGAFGSVNPRRRGAAGECAGGRLAGAPRD